MAHPFYGNYVKPSSDNSFSKLQDFITQASRLQSNERTARKAQEGAKERLAMQLDSTELMFNRTETRLDTRLKDVLKNSKESRATSKQNRYINLEKEMDRQEMHPI